MPRNGSGTYAPPAGQPVVTGTTIDSSVFNAVISDIGVELTRSLPTDGQTPMAANLPMGGNKITGLGVATLASDAARFDQVGGPANTLRSDLAASTGAALVGANDGAAGTLFTTIAGFLTKLFSSAGAALVGWIRAGTGPVATTVGAWFERQPPTIHDFMTAAQITDAQSMAPALDHTAAILAYKTYALAHLPFNMVFPRGWYRYSDIGNCAYAGLSMTGASHRETIMQCTTTVPALMVDAFKPGLTGNDATAPFVMQMNISNITFQGANGAAKILDLQGIARCVWRNVFVRNCDSAAGIAVHMRGCMLNSFYNIGCSIDIDTMASVPYEGLRMEAGVRNSISVGNSSNNTFTNPYFEGMQINGRLSSADQNTFISGSFETGGVYDFLVSGPSRYNTLIGVGFESTTVTANVSDAGVYTKYINCYANKNFILQGTGTEIRGGYFHKIDIQAASSGAYVYGVTIKHWESSFPGAGGFFNAGAATRRGRIYDEVAVAYVFAASNRTGITVGASPFTYTNISGLKIRVIAQSGTVTQVRQGRAGDLWLVGPGAPNTWDIDPGDTLELSYSVIPSLSFITHQEI